MSALARTAALFGAEEYSYFFVRVLATARGGAATISECISASKNIVPGDGESCFVHGTN